MALWGKKPPQPPDWARQLSPEKWALFAATVGQALDAIHASDQRAAIAAGVLNLRNSAGNMEAFGLQNLMQMLAMQPTADWPRLVAEHFEAMLTVDKLPVSGEQAIELLRVRIWHEDYLGQLPKVIHKKLAPGLILALVVDLPKKVMSLVPDQLQAWGLTEDLAWSAAEQNTRREPIELVPQKSADGVEMFFIVGENLYVTSHAVWLDEHVTLNRDHGALVGIPTRHLIVVLPIRDLRALKALGQMHAANLRIFDEGPGSISASVYWWHAGAFTLIPINVSVQPAQVTPPDDFVAMLNRLSSTSAAPGPHE